MRLEGTCPQCGAPLADYARMDGFKLVCTRCGYVIEEEMVDVGPEWRAYSAEEKLMRSRVGAPLTERTHDRNVTTVIQARPNDLRAQKLASLQRHLRTLGQRRLIEVLSELNDAAARLNLPGRVVETASRIVKILYHRYGVIRRNNAAEYIAAALYAASRIEKHTITMKDIAQALDVDVRRAWNAFQKIVAKLEQNLRLRMTGPMRPEMYVSQVASKLKLSSQAESLAYRFAALLSKTGIAQGKPPQPLAAAAVYLASILMDEKRNQSEVAKIVGVSDATIRNRYRDIVDNFYIEVYL
jgi:transcription initiation factor TFIIB